MINVYTVTYWESPEAEHCSSRHFSSSSLREASMFAKVISKKVGRSARVWKSRGGYIGSEFYSEESTLKSTYENGIKQ